jgi:hypothetical protein
MVSSSPEAFATALALKEAACWVKAQSISSL